MEILWHFTYYTLYCLTSQKFCSLLSRNDLKSVGLDNAIQFHEWQNNPTRGPYPNVLIVLAQGRGLGYLIQLFFLIICICIPILQNNKQAVSKIFIFIYVGLKNLPFILEWISKLDLTLFALPHIEFLRKENSKS